MMKNNCLYFNTDIGLILKTHGIYYLKSSKEKKIISEEEFYLIHPLKISKAKYLQLLNKYWSEVDLEWEFLGVKYKKLPNFTLNYNFENLSFHDENIIIVLYQGKIYNCHFNGLHFPRVQLTNFFHTPMIKKWTHIKNLAPILNCETNKII